MIYLASPYSHPDANVRHARYEAACQKAAEMMRDGRLVYSPIVHSHPLGELGLPGDWPFWAEHNRRMLGVCSGLVVLQLSGWERSRGVAEEIRIAETIGLPTQFELLAARDASP